MTPGVRWFIAFLLLAPVIVMWMAAQDEGGGAGARDSCAGYYAACP